MVSCGNWDSCPGENSYFSLEEHGLEPSMTDVSRIQIHREVRTGLVESLIWDVIQVCTSAQCPIGRSCSWKTYRHEVLKVMLVIKTALSLLADV